MDINEFFNQIKEFFTSNYVRIIIFFAILIGGIVLIALILKLVRTIIKKNPKEKIIQRFCYHVLKFALWLTLIIILLQYMGISITGILAALGALLLAIGLALQNLLSNVANGMVIITTKMFKKGDFVILNEHQGFVEDINFIYLTLITYDGKKVTIPNSSILTNTVSTFGGDKVKRLEFNFSVAYETDVELVKSIVLNVMKSSGRVLNKPEPPLCRLNKFGASSIDFFAYCWVDFEDYLDVHYYIMENVYNEFKRNKVTIPYMQVELRERTEKVKMPVINAKLQVEKTKTRKPKINEDMHDEYINDLGVYTKRADVVLHNQNTTKQKVESVTTSKKKPSKKTKSSKQVKKIKSTKTKTKNTHKK